MTTRNEITDAQIEALMYEAGASGDAEQVAICELALCIQETVTIETAKGSHTGSLKDVCAWQGRVQGAFATIGTLDVDAVDFDAEDIGSTKWAVQRAARAECVRVIADAAARNAPEAS